MMLKIPFALVVIMLASFVSTSNAQKAALILDQIARSLPQIDPGWKHISTEMYERNDGSTQASIKWSNGEIERGATVIVHPTLKRARQAFRPSGKEDLQEGFRIEGIGDEAFVWPPKAAEGGAYNIRFRRARVEVWMSGGTEGDVKRYALAICAAIAPPNKRMQRRPRSKSLMATFGARRGPGHARR